MGNDRNEVEDNAAEVLRAVLDLEEATINRR